jgi:hypothetical protein
VPYQIQASVRQFYAYHLKHTPSSMSGPEENGENLALMVIDHMGPEIKKTLNIVCHLQYLKKCPTLYQNFSTELIEILASKCISKSYSENEIIVSPES